MLKNCLKLCLLLTLIALLPSLAEGQNKRKKFKTDLVGIQEVPALSTTGNGTFEMHINGADSEFTFELSYDNLMGDVLQAHIHIGQHGVNGGIMVFLCSNLGNGPPGTQECPAPSGTVSGTIRPADVIGPAGQGISAGEFAEVLKAIREGVAYANVHSSLFPGGEIRGQLVSFPKEK